MGDKGDKGDPGADGQLRIFGDGSAGAATVTNSGTFFIDVAADGNPQFTDFTVNAGVTLTVPSGVVIRCTGTFTNNGTVVVQNGASGGAVDVGGAVISGGTIPSIVGANPGVSRVAAGSGEIGDATAIRVGGFRGEGLPVGQARSLLRPGVFGGGGGGSGTANQVRGGNGGGSLVVLASTSVVNAGLIDASAPGAFFITSGAGAGGVVIIASPGSIATGTIHANGAAGAAGNTAAAAGGGGGGGIVHLIAPAITAGTIQVDPGIAGTNGPTVTANPRSGGGGGGGCGGTGGFGGGVNTNGTILDAQAGLAGHSLQTVANPTALL